MAFSETEQAEIDQLIKEMDILLQKRDQLLKKWGAIQARKWLQTERFPNGKNNGFYYIPDREFTRLNEKEQTEWNDSFFFTHTNMYDELSFMTLNRANQSQLMQDQAYETPILPSVDYEYRRFIVTCKSILPCDNGFRLVLSDPYGSILTSIITDMSITDAESWIDQIISVEIGFRLGSMEHPIKNAYAIGYSKYN